MSDRPKLPRSLDREIRLEAGHRCAIPRCQRIPVEVAHIKPRKPNGSNDAFENLIALCPSCLARYDRGEIDRASLRQHKRNLGVLKSRYSDLEYRLLETFARHDPGTVIPFHQDMSFDFHYLLEDGYLWLVHVQRTTVARAWTNGIWHYALTEEGEDFLDRWLDGEPLDREQHAGLATSTDGADPLPG